MQLTGRSCAWRCDRQAVGRHPRHGLTFCSEQCAEAYDIEPKPLETLWYLHFSLLRQAAQERVSSGGGGGQQHYNELIDSQLSTVDARLVIHGKGGSDSNGNTLERQLKLQRDIIFAQKLHQYEEIDCVAKLSTSLGELCGGTTKLERDTISLALLSRHDDDAEEESRRVQYLVMLAQQQQARQAPPDVRVMMMRHRGKPRKVIK